MNHYETLGVSQAATHAEIKAAYRREASKAHPDREGGNTERIQAVNVAWDVLGDPGRRRAYDRQQDPAARAQDDAAAREEAIQRGGLSLLTQFFEHAIKQGIPKPVMFARVQADGTLHDLVQQRATSIKRVHQLEGMRDRVIAKQGTYNLYTALIDGQIAGHRRAVGNLNQSLKMASRARRILRDYIDNIPPEEERPLATVPDGNLLAQLMAYGFPNHRRFNHG